MRRCLCAIFSTVYADSEMGESKRRRQLDPNYGQPNILGFGANRTQEFFGKKLDIAIVKAEHIFPEIFAGIDRQFGTCHQLIIPTKSQENDARQFFTDNKQRYLDAIEPVAREHGKGWIYQTYIKETDFTEFGYIPANWRTLESLGTEVFVRGTGKQVKALMHDALRCWHWDDCVPVLAMSTDDDAPSWIYIA